MSRKPFIIHPDKTLVNALFRPEPPVVVQNPSGSTVNKTPLNDMADGRDIISFFVGGGHTALKGQDLQSAFKRLSDVVGAPLAQKLTTQAFLFNQRPDAQKLSSEQRVKNFFQLGSNDQDVAAYLRKGGSMGTGPVDAFRNSALLGNSNLLGKYIMPDPGSNETSKAVQRSLGL
jgi:hypothetical protein